MPEEATDVSKRVYTTPFDNDILLEAFLEYSATHPDAQMGITLTTPGGIVSGDLVGSKRWFDELKTRHPEISEFAGQIYDAFKNDPDDDRDIEYVSIHLINARVYNGGAGIPVDGGCWRGRLSKVVGWQFGTLTSAD